MSVNGWWNRFLDWLEEVVECEPLICECPVPDVNRWNECGWCRRLVYDETNLQVPRD